MKLAVFTNEFPGTVNTFFARDIRALLDAGIEVDVFSLYPYNPKLWRNVPDILDEDTFPRSRVHHLNMATCLPALRHFVRREHRPLLRDIGAISLSACRFGMSQLIKSSCVVPMASAWAARFAGEYDHVLAYWGNYAATCAYLFCRFSQPSVPFSMFLHAGTDLYRDQVYLREKLIAADRVFVVCEFNRQFIRRLYPDDFGKIDKKIHLHHLGLDLAQIVPCYEPPANPNVIAVGRLVKAKGFDFLLQAAAQLKSCGIKLTVDLVGDGEEAGNLRQLAAQLGIQDEVRFRGWLASEDVLEAIKESTILAHPSAGLGDAVPTTIKEAMAVGTPVIASDVAGIPELLNRGRCGILVPPRNEQALADGIRTLLTDEQLRQHYARVGRKFAESHFDMWQNGRVLANHLTNASRAIRRPVRIEQVRLGQPTLARPPAAQ